MEVKLEMGAKTFACLVFENIFRSGRNDNGLCLWCKC
jgi:hypothetical protein